MQAARRKSLNARRHHLLTVHHMTLEQYEAIKAFQGGVCYMCQRANGNSRALSVDHDHKKAETCGHPVNQSCERCWRGLLCSVDNKILGHARDAVTFFERSYDYLVIPPAQRMAETFAAAA